MNVKGEVTVRTLNNMSDAELLKFLSGQAPLALPAPSDLADEVIDLSAP